MGAREPLAPLHPASFWTALGKPTPPPHHHRATRRPLPASPPWLRGRLRVPRRQMTQAVAGSLCQLHDGFGLGLVASCLTVGSKAISGSHCFPSVPGREGWRAGSGGRWSQCVCFHQVFQRQTFLLLFLLPTAGGRGLSH